ncbi:MAG: T9SS type A sorting domain-containing protein [Bacteroidetes bacterium]|nr:T9SS type A sorting domain-containing protein [Bacteroidota bacterium]
MNKKLIAVLLSLLGLLTTNQAYSQNFKKIKSSTGYNVEGLIKINDNEFVCYGNSPFFEITIFSMDSNFTINWEKKLTGAFYAGSNIWGMYTSDSSLVFTTSYYTGPMNSGANIGLMVLKMDLLGNVIFSNRFYEQVNTREYYPRKIFETSQGNYIITGVVIYTQNMLTGDPFICSVSPNGVLQWHKQANFGSSYHDAIELTDGDILVGSQMTGGLLSRFDHAGNAVQHVSLSNLWNASCLKLLSDGNIMVCGTAYAGNNLESEMSLIKLDQNLNPIWAYRYDLDSAIFGPRNFYPIHLNEDANGNIIGAGNYWQQYVSSLGGFYFSVDALGLPISANVFNTELWYTNSIVSTPSFEFVVGINAYTTYSLLIKNIPGYFPCQSYGADLIETPMPVIVSNSQFLFSQQSFFTDSIKYSISNPNVTITEYCQPLGFDEDMTLNMLSIHPNPAIDRLTLTKSFTQPISVTIYNLAGAEVKNMKVSDEQTNVNLDDLSAGSYTLVGLSMDGTMRQSLKFIVLPK